MNQKIPDFNSLFQNIMKQANISQKNTSQKSPGESGKKEDKKPKILLKFPLNYSLSSSGGQETAHGEATVQLAEGSLTILPKFGEVIYLSLRDIADLSENDYKVRLVLTSNENLTLSNLGYQYEDFLRVFAGLRNEILLKDMLMQEGLRKSNIAAEVVYLDEEGGEKLKGKCSLRLYDTAIVVIPEKADLTRIPYSDISEIKDEDYKLAITTDAGEKITFSMLGKEFDSTISLLSKTINELSLAVQSSLKELIPDANPSIIRQAARLMKEGKAARRSDIEAISPALWAGLEKKVASTEIKEEYNFLVGMAQKEKLCIGVKRGLMGGLTSDYIWFLIPIYSLNPEAPGNAVAMEAIAQEGSGKATYFFRLAGRNAYRSFKNIDELHRIADDFIVKMNRCMLTINFRREPIYLSDERLQEPRYQHYRSAIQKIPSLQTLRSLFIGRVIHASDEQWQHDATNLLRFNVSTADDAARWSKAGEADADLPEDETADAGENDTSDDSQKGDDADTNSASS
jgi:hypothetical protein